MRQAEADLSAAEKNLAIAQAYVASLLVQQAAEKALKAVLLAKGNPLIKTHDLPFLAERLQAPPAVFSLCKKLSPVYLETRYPLPSGKWRVFTRAEAEQDVEMAKEVLA